MAKKKQAPEGGTARGAGKPVKAKGSDGLLGTLTRVVAVLFVASLLLEQVAIG